MRHKFVAKTPEYFVYFKVFAADLWGKRTAKARRRNCAVLPLILPHFTGKGQCRFLQWGISIMVYRGRARRGEDVCPIFITCSGASAGSSDGRYAPKPPLCKGRWLGFRGPGEAQRQRVHWGEEEQRSDCAFRPQGGNKGCGACDDEAEGLMLGSNLLLGTARLFGSS